MLERKAALLERSMEETVSSQRGNLQLEEEGGGREMITQDENTRDL
jgi:hypothetical protein